MIIQKIIFPGKEICNEWKMYFRSDLPQNCDGSIDPRNNDEEVRNRMEANAKKAEGSTVTFDSTKELIGISAGESVSLETYFNAFSIGKWVKYTGIKSLKLELYIQGDAEIHMYHAIGHTSSVAQTGRGDVAMYEGLQVDRRGIDDECEITHTGSCYTIELKKMYDEGIVYPEIMAVSDIQISGGAYVTDDLPRNDVNIALGICTFKREDFVTSNVAKVIRDTIANTDSPIYGHLEAYISDNGQTLSMEDFKSAYASLSGADGNEVDLDEKIHLFSNMNAGGAGGFTRTMIESLIRREGSAFSHIILMDDDIVLDHTVDDIYVD